MITEKKGRITKLLFLSILLSFINITLFADIQVEFRNSKEKAYIKTVKIDNIEYFAVGELQKVFKAKHIAEDRLENKLSVSIYNETISILLNSSYASFKGVSHNFQYDCFYRNNTWYLPIHFLKNTLPTLFPSKIRFNTNNTISADSVTDNRIKVIVLDPGHGGKDPGATGKISKEKDITLDMAFILKNKLEKELDGVQVLLTRSKDEFVSLQNRTKFANNQQAHLFISIHCNAATNKAAQGVETFVMGLHKSEASLAVAKKENAAILLEKNYENNYEGFNPNSPEANIIFSLYTSAYLKNSTALAGRVQKNLVKNTNFRDRTVQQAGFWVLYKVAMPSILIELGFLSNEEEEAMMMQEATQRVMAQSIYNAFVDYKNNMEGTNKKGIDIVPIYKQSKNIQLKEEVPVVENQENKNIEDSSTAQKNEGRDSIRFRIQIYATLDDIAITNPRFKSLDKVQRYSENGWWKYTTGDENNFESASSLLKEVKSKGFPDAFMIAFNNDEKISVNEAKRLLQRK